MAVTLQFQQERFGSSVTSEMTTQLACTQIFIK